MRPLDLRVAAARAAAERPLARPVVRDEVRAVSGVPSLGSGLAAPTLRGRTTPYGRDADLAALAARAATWSAGAGEGGAPGADVELSVRVLAHGGSITVARQVVDGRVAHIEAIVR